MIKKKFFQSINIAFSVLLITTTSFSIAGTHVRSYADSSQQELTDLKIAVGSYEDGLYKIAIQYLKGFLKKYPKSKFTIQVNLLLANAYQKAGKTHEALETYQKILNKRKSLTEADLLHIHYSMYEILKKGQPSIAVSHLKFIVNVSIKKKIKNNLTYKAFLDLSRYFKRQRRPKQAERVLNQLLSLSPPDPWKSDALLQKAYLMILQKRFQALRSFLEPIVKKPLKMDTQGKELYFYWAVTNLNLKRYCIAQETYRKLIDPFMDTPTLSSVINGYILSFTRCFADEHVREKIFLSLYKKFKNRPSILFKIYNLEGLIYYQEGKYPKARETWIKILRNFPDHPGIPEILIKLDRIFRETSSLKTWEGILLQINKSKKFLTETRQIDNFLLGNLYFSQGMYETALPFYFSIISNKRYRRICLEKIVLCYYYLKKYKETKTNLDILLLENPKLLDKSSILFLKADLLMREKKTEKAMEILEKIVAKKKSHKGLISNIWVVKAELELGEIYFLRKDFIDAKAHLLNVLKQVTDDIEDNRIAAFYLGLISEKEKKPELSETYFQIASLSKNTSIRVESLFRLALTKKVLRSYHESEKIFMYIIKSFHKYPKWQELSRLQLAEIYFDIKEYEKAKTQAKYLIEKSGDAEIKSKAGQLLLRIKNMHK